MIIKASEFVPIANKGAKNPKYENQICHGIFIEYIDKSIEPIDLAIDLLSYFSKPSNNRILSSLDSAGVVRMISTRLLILRAILSSCPVLGSPEESL